MRLAYKAAGSSRNRNRILALSHRIGLEKVAAMRNRQGLKIAALLCAALVFCAELSCASQLALSKSSSHKDYVWIGIVVAICGGIAFLMDNYMARVKIKKIREVARSLGFTYRSRPTPTDRELPVGCYLAKVGFQRTVSNVLEVVDTDELNFILFDFDYTLGKSTFSQTIARMRSPLLKLPSLLLFPETIFSKMAVMFGCTDVNFPDSPKFSDKYILRGQDEAALRALFTPALRDALEPLEDLTIEGADDVLFIFRERRLVEPEEIPSRIEEDKRILALFFDAQQAHAKVS
jgi:hypothetical protein